MASRLVLSLQEFLKREDGPTAVEYAVMLSLIVVACIGTIGALGGSASDTFALVYAAPPSNSGGGSGGSGTPDSFGFVPSQVYNLYKDTADGSLHAVPAGNSVPANYEPGLQGTYSGGGTFVNSSNGAAISGVKLD